MQGLHYSREGETAFLLLPRPKRNQSLQTQVQISRRLELKRHK